MAPGATVAVVDVGHRRTSVAVGRPAEGLVFARTFAGGGRDLTRALAAEFQVGLAEAEAWKERDGSLLAGGGPEHDRARTALLRALAPIVREVRASLKASSSREHQPARLLVAGGSARLPGLPEHLGTELGVPADRALLPAVATPVIGPVDQPRACQAYALALRGAAASRGPRFNLRQGEFAFRGHFEPARASGSGGGLRRGAGGALRSLQRGPGSPARSPGGRGGRPAVRGDPAGPGELRDELRPGAQHAAGQGEPGRSSSPRVGGQSPRRGWERIR